MERAGAVEPRRLEVSLDPAQSAASLCAFVEKLRGEIVRDGERLLADWQSTAMPEEFLPSARNLAHYLSLRRADLRQIQPALRALGLSTLGRSEPHVLASIDAVFASLSRVAGCGAPSYPPAAAFAAGSTLLEQRQNRVFGGDPQGPRTRIMVTLPSEAAEQPDLIRALIAEGADCIRINCAHDGPAAWAAMIAHARATAVELERDVKVAMDLPGPKIRVVSVHASETPRLFEGDRFVIVAEPSAAPRLPEITLSHQALLDHLQPGAELWMDDGKLGARVVARERDRAALLVTRAKPKGYKLKPEKGLNLPGAELAIPALTVEDIAHLGFVADHADIIGYSFVQTPEDVRGLVAELDKRMQGRPLPALMLKIETPLAVRNLPRLIVQAGAHMPVTVMSRDRARTPVRDPGRNPLAVRGGACARGLGHAGSGKPGQGRNGHARRDHGCGHGPACRMRDAEQGSASGEGSQLPGPDPAADGPPPEQEIGAAGAAQVMAGAPAPLRVRSGIGPA